MQTKKDTRPISTILNSSDLGRDLDNPPQSYDYIDKPPHYHRGGYGCYQVLEAIGFGDNYNVGTAFTYIWRAGYKPGNPKLQDLRKAITHLEWECRRLENE